MTGAFAINRPSIETVRVRGAAHDATSDVGLALAEGLVCAVERENGLFDRSPVPFSLRVPVEPT